MNKWVSKCQSKLTEAKQQTQQLCQIDAELRQNLETLGQQYWEQLHFNAHKIHEDLQKQLTVNSTNSDDIGIRRRRPKGVEKQSLSAHTATVSTDKDNSVSSQLTHTLLFLPLHRSVSMTPCDKGTLFDPKMNP